MLTDTQCRAAHPCEKAYKLADGGGRHGTLAAFLLM